MGANVSPPPRRCLFAICIGCLAGCSSNGPSPSETPPKPIQAWFQEAGDAFNFLHEVGDPADYDMPQIMGSGAGLVDLDQDGQLETLLVGNRQIAVLNDQNRAFVDVAGASRLAVDAFGMGVTAGDLNEDGFTDLYITNYGADTLWINNGDGTFSDVTSRCGLIQSGWGTAACLCDENRDGMLDLFVVNYVDYVPGQWCEDNAGRQEFCGPSSFSGTVDRLFRNAGYQAETNAPVFTDATIPSGFGANPGKGLGVVCGDLTGDGRPDFYVANDMESNHLWVQQDDGTYVDEALWRGIALNALGEAEASMGTVLADLDGDLSAELFVTHLSGESNTLYQAISHGQFEDVTPSSGLETTSLQFTGFGIACADFECDGDLDLAIANGRVQRGPAADHCELNGFWCEYAETNQLFLNNGAGRFVVATSEGGLLTERIEVSRGLAQGDIDNDGDVDLLLTNCSGSARLYINHAAPRGNWLMLTLVDSVGNRRAIGARVTITAGDTSCVRGVSPALGYLTTSDVRLHFGLANHAEYDRLTVEWTDGMSEEFPGGTANRHLLLCRGGRVLETHVD
jgi:hypothetical protein